MDVAKEFGTNKKKEQEGTWVDGPKGAKFLIARANNDKAEELAKHLMRPHRRMARAGKLPDAVQKKITIAVMANTILLGWEHFKENGKPLTYSHEEAERVLTAYPDFAEFVAAYAAEASTFQDEEEEERRGNSSSASAGT